MSCVIHFSTTPLFISLSLFLSPSMIDDTNHLKLSVYFNFLRNFSARCIIKQKTFPFGRAVSFPRLTIERSGIHGYLSALFQPKRINLPYNYQFEDPLYYNCISIKREFLYTTRSHRDNTHQPIASFILSTKYFYYFL